MDGTSSYPSDAEQEQQQENVNRDVPQINMEGNPFAMTPPQEAPSQPHWNREPEHQSLHRQNLHQRMGVSVSLTHFSCHYMKVLLGVDLCSCFLLLVRLSNICENYDNRYN